MKKFIVTILAVFYLGIASGATVHFHYCMGQLIDSGLISKESKKCGECDMEVDSSKSCCKTETKQVNIDNAQKLDCVSYHFEVVCSDLALNKYSTIPQIHISSVILEQARSNAPPFKDNTPVFIHNCTFLI